MATNGPRRKNQASIFIAHPSAHLTDHALNGDGLIAHGFLSRLAERGYDLHVTVDRVSLQTPFPARVTLYPIALHFRNTALRLLEYSLKMRLLFNRLRRQHRFGLALQMNPVFPGISLFLVGTGVPVVLGTYVPRWGAGATGFSDLSKGDSAVLAKMRNAIVALQQSHAAALLLTTPAAANRLPVLQLDSPKIFYIPHGIDTDLFHPAEPGTGATENYPPSILYLARVSERKGIFDLLAAMPDVAAAVPGVRLSIVGSGEDLDRVKEQIAALPCRDQIDLVGPVDRDATAPLYRRHTLYCLPSYGEPNATSLLEAMSSGLPIVSTTTGGTPYLVPGDGGILVAPKDVGGLANALIRVLGSPQLQQEMGRLNRRVAVETFAWEKVIDRLEETYFQVTDGSVGRPANEPRDAMPQ